MDREALLAKAKEMLSAAEATGEVFTPEQQTEYDGYLSKIKAIDQQTEAANRLAELQTAPPKRQLRQPQPEAVTQPEADNTPAPVVLPAGVKRHRALRAFKDEATAYKFGKFLLGTVFGKQDARDWCQRHGVMLAQSEGSNAAGGYVVPDQFEQTIIDLRETYGVFRQNARVWPMASDTLIVPRRASGLTAYYVGEADQITESTKGWDNVTLVAKKLGCLARYSSEVAEDAIITMADDLAGEIAYAFAYTEDLAGFLGDGTSTYGGITGIKNKVAAGSIYTAITGNTAFSTLDLADFHAMTGKLPLYARAGAKWYISAPGYADSMERLAYAAGGNNKMDIGGGMTTVFLGYPVVLSQVMNSTLTAQTSATGVVYFGNLTMAAALGSRRGVTVRLSEERYFEYDQIGIRGTERFDINVHEIGTASVAGAVVSMSLPGS